MPTVLRTPDVTHLPPSQLFTLHLWLENLGGGAAEWRGQVRHVPSGETRYFRDWPTLIAFLQTWGALAFDEAGPVTLPETPPRLTDEREIL